MVFVICQSWRLCCVTVTSPHTSHASRPLSLTGHTYLSLSTHHVTHCADCSGNRHVWYFCLFVSVVSVDFATAWSNGSPVFFSHFSIWSHLFFIFLIFLILLIFCFCFYFVCFWPQQVGIDQGDIPDLSQVSVHLTFHVLFFLLQTPTHLLASLSSHLELLSSFVWLYCLLSASLHLLFFFFSPQNKPMFAPYASFSSHSVPFNHYLLILVSNNCLL